MPAKELRLFLFSSQDDAGGTNGEEGSVVDDASFAITENLIVDKCSGVARTVAKHIFQLASLVAADVDDAMGDVNTGVHRFDGAVDTAVFLITTDDVVAHAQRDDLLEVEDVLDDDNRAAAVGIGLLVWVHVVALGVAKLRDTDANAELLSAIGTLKHQRLTRLVERFIKNRELVALRAANSLHSVNKQLEFHHPTLGKL